MAEMTAIEAECLSSLAQAAWGQSFIDDMTSVEQECRKSWHYAEQLSKYDPRTMYMVRNWGADLGDQWQRDYLGDHLCQQ